jgi:bifunctional enzyme CysN/CysC
VQWVARTRDFRGLCGTIVEGQAKVGQEILVLPGNTRSRIKQIVTFDGPLDNADAESAVCIQLEDDLDAGRGDMLCAANNPPTVSDRLAARMVWLNDPPLVTGRTYLFRQANAEAMATVLELSARVDLNTQQELSAKILHVNDVGRVKLALDRPLPIAPYAGQRDLGGFLLIDRLSRKTLGAGMIDFAMYRGTTVIRHDFTLGKTAFASQKNQRPLALWFTGLSASGKSTIANLVAQKLFALGRHIYILDGDDLRHGLNSDLGFTEPDRAENIRRASEVAKLMVDAGLIVLASFISPYRSDRRAIRDRFAPGEFVEIFMDTPLDLCAQRDVKGLYKRAQAGDIPNFTGVSAPFEAPQNPDLHLDGRKSPEALAEEVLAFIELYAQHNE